MIIYTSTKRERRDWSATYYWDRKLRELGVSVNYHVLYSFMHRYAHDRVLAVIKYVLFEHGESELKRLYKQLKRSKLKRAIERYFLEKIMS